MSVHQTHAWCPRRSESKLELLKLKLQVVVSHHVGAGALQAQQMFLTHESSLQTSVLIVTHIVQTH